MYCGVLTCERPDAGGIATSGSGALSPPRMGWPGPERLPFPTRGRVVFRPCAMAQCEVMQRGSGNAITGWAAILLSPVAIPIAIIARLLPGRKAVDRTPEDVVGYLTHVLEGTCGEWDWDDFECVPITDPHLDDIRRRAALAGPPDANVAVLRLLISEAEAVRSRWEAP